MVIFLSGLSSNSSSLDSGGNVSYYLSQATGTVLTEKEKGRDVPVLRERKPSLSLFPPLILR